MATLSLTSTKTSITGKLSGLQTVSYGRTFDWYFDGVFDHQDWVGMNVTPGTLSGYWSGLSSGTTYTVEVVVTNDDTGTIVADFDKSIATESDPVVMGTVSVSPATIIVNDSITLTWTYSGLGSTSSYFDIYASQSADFSTAAIVASVSYPTATKTATWSRAGVWYFWVVYRGNSSRTTNYATLTVTQSGWIQATPYVYHNGTWRAATVKIYSNGWKTATPKIYKEST